MSTNEKEMFALESPMQVERKESSSHMEDIKETAVTSQQIRDVSVAMTVGYNRRLIHRQP